MSARQHQPLRLSAQETEDRPLNTAPPGPAAVDPSNAAAQEALRTSTKHAVDATVLGTRVGASGLAMLPGMAAGDGKLLKGSASAMLAPLTFLSHLWDPDQVARSEGGQLASAGAKTALQVATDLGAAAAGGLSTAGLAFEAKHNLAGGVDAAGALHEALAGRSSTAMQKGEQMEELTAGGKYGIFPQAAGMLTQGMDRYTDARAARGERGTLLAMSSWLSGASPVPESGVEPHEAVWQRGTTREILDDHGGRGEVEWQDTRTLGERLADLQEQIDGLGR